MFRTVPVKSLSRLKGMLRYTYAQQEPQTMQVDWCPTGTSPDWFFRKTAGNLQEATAVPIKQRLARLEFPQGNSDIWGLHPIGIQWPEPRCYVDSGSNPASGHD